MDSDVVGNLLSFVPRRLSGCDKTDTRLVFLLAEIHTKPLCNCVEVYLHSLPESQKGSSHGHATASPMTPAVTLHVSGVVLLVGFGWVGWWLDG